MLVDIVRLAKRFNIGSQSRAFDIKFTRQGLVKLIAKDTNLVFLISVYTLFHSSN